MSDEKVVSRRKRTRQSNPLRLEENSEINISETMGYAVKLGQTKACRALRRNGIGRISSMVPNVLLRGIIDFFDEIITLAVLYAYNDGTKVVTEEHIIRALEHLNLRTFR